MARKSDLTVNGESSWPGSFGRQTYFLALGIAVLVSTKGAYHFAAEAILRRLEASFFRERIQAGRHVPGIGNLRVNGLA